MVNESGTGCRGGKIIVGLPVRRDRLGKPVEFSRFGLQHFVRVLFIDNRESRPIFLRRTEHSEPATCSARRDYVVESKCDFLGL